MEDAAAAAMGLPENSDWFRVGRQSIVFVGGRRLSVVGVKREEREKVDLDCCYC